MLNDKHIEQHAMYLIEEIPNGMDIMSSLPQDIWNVMISMYKKGYEDCDNSGLFTPVYGK